MSPKECEVYRPERRRDLDAILGETDLPHRIARGVGRSYGDTAVNDGGAVIRMERLNRMIAFDAETGLLHCEAGVSLAEIIEAFLPRGFFLPVTPGTKFVTVGGAIANDVHGKNHHGEGTFSQFVREIALMTANGEVMTCSADEAPEVFWATAGGIGLTGIILSAKVQLQPVESAYIKVDYTRAQNLDAALTTMAESDCNYQYSVAWVDCLAGGASLGRSVLMRGNHAVPDDLDPKQARSPFALKQKRAKTVPIDFPGFALNPLAIKAFNTVFHALHPNANGMVADYDSYFYPLDGIHHWNRMYGKRGFVQYQASLPPDQDKGMLQLLEKLSRSKRASFLAVLKCFGEANPGLLSHPMRGYTLTLDIPNHNGLMPFLSELDRIVLDHGGRLYLAKDSATTKEAISVMYPRLDEFREIKERLDPECRFSSTMARRLGIVSASKREGEAT